MTESRNYRVATIQAFLSCCTCSCRTYVSVFACGTVCRPCSAAAIPCTFFYCEVVSATCGNCKVSCLIPFVIPVISCCAGIHTAENNVRISFSCGNLYFINTVAIGVSHRNPCFAISEEICCKTCVALLPVSIRSQVKILRLRCCTCCEH